MVGIIQKGMAQGSKITPQTIMAQLHLQPPQVVPLQRIVAAGMKVMFDAKTHQLMLDQLRAPGPLPDKIGQGVAGLVVLLQKEAHGSLPGNLLVPAGMVLVAHAADFLRQAGQKVTDQDVGGAIAALNHMLCKAARIDPNKLPEPGQQAAAATESPVQEPAAPADLGGGEQGE